MTINRTCVCCQKKYAYCPNCSKADALKEPWYATFCSGDCMKLWTTATKFNMNMLTKQEAKEIISTISLKPINEYVSCVQRDLGVIMKEDPKPRRSKRIAAQSIDEVVVIEPTLIDETYEVVTELNK